MGDVDLRHTTPAFRTFAGDRALSSLPREIDRLGAERVVIICGASIAREATALDGVRAALGDRLVGQFEGAAEQSPLPLVEEAKDVLAEAGADAIVAVGGGSAVVTARAATILLGEGGTFRDLCTRREADGSLVSPRLRAAKIPQWVVPSTPTTAYAKAGGAVRDPETNERLALFDPKARAQGVFLDPTMAGTSPERLVWSASLNAFAMAVEGLAGQRDDPLADALLAQALRLVVRWLPQLAKRPDDPQLRVSLMVAALLSGQGSDYTGGGLAQGLSHAVGPRSNVANGVVEALLLPAALSFEGPANAARLDQMAAVLGGPGETGKSVVEKIEQLLSRFGVPRRLSDAGVPETALEASAAHAMDDWAIAALPRPPRRDEVIDLLRGAW